MNWSIFLLVYLIHSIKCCELWIATSGCQGAPSEAEEEKMRNDDYTKEELYKYCDKGKAYVDCLNKKLKCCDLKPEFRASIKTADLELQKAAWKLGPYCAGLGESNVIQYKCKTTKAPPTTMSTTNSDSPKITKTTLAPCNIDKASEECNPILDGRVKFEEEWNVYDKMQWCRDTIDYVTCANQYLLNCNISSLRTEADQLQQFIDFVTKSANVHCPGGITGCENNTNDVRCRLGMRYFLGENYMNSLASTNFNLNLILIFVATLGYFIF